MHFVTTQILKLIKTLITVTSMVFLWHKEKISSGQYLCFGFGSDIQVLPYDTLSLKLKQELWCTIIYNIYIYIYTIYIYYIYTIYIYYIYIYYIYIYILYIYTIYIYICIYIYIYIYIFQWNHAIYILIHVSTVYFSLLLPHAVMVDKEMVLTILK